MQSNKCDFRNIAPSSKCDFRALASSKCDFRMLEFRGAASAKCDWRLNLGALTARGVTNRLQALDVAMAAQRLRVISDKCDFRVTIGTGATAQTAVSAAIRSDKCDFNVALLGTRAGRSALGRIATHMASDKCDFRVNLQFGSDPNPLFRVVAVASDKCDFRLQQLEIREGDKWRTVDLAPRKGK